MDSSTKIILIVVLAVLLILSGFFSAAETAYTSISSAKLKQKSSKGKKSAKLIEKHYKSFGWTLATILISNNLVNIGASSLTTYLFTDLMGASTLVTVISTFVVTPIIVIFGEITPKIFARKYAYGYLSKVVYIMEVLNWLFFPITFPLSKVALSSKVTNTETELKSLLNIARTEGVIDAEEATLAQRALDLDSLVVSKIMVKKKNIISIKADRSLREAKDLIIKSGHSRLIVIQNNVYVGIIHIKDVLGQPNSRKVEEFMIRPIYLSKLMLANKALEAMRKDKTHLALVTDKTNSKNVVGILSLEDIIEELVGEIYDEHDSTDKVREISHHKFVAQGSALMTTLNSKVKVINFEGIEDDQNIKQWLQGRIQRRLKFGLTYTYKNKIVFKVLKNKNKEETIFQITVKKR